MKLNLNKKLAAAYHGKSQKIRVLTEDWVDRWVFCPNCGRFDIQRYENNRPVADFHCAHCLEEYELKSKQNLFGVKIVDGAYRTMMERLKSAQNPNLFLLTYRIENPLVTNFYVIPKYFFVPGMIEKRSPLSQTARRAGWIGCNILVRQVPEAGKIFFVRNGTIRSKKEVLADWQRTHFLKSEQEITAKGWLLDVMRSIEKIGKREFMLENVYAFKKQLARWHPENRHIEDKIRQQLQVLRDKGYLEFSQRGRYRLR